MALDPGSSRGSAVDLGTLSTSRLKQTIGSKDKLDFYRFSLSGSSSSSFSARLRGLKANANLALLSSSGTVLQQSKLPGTAKESLNLSLTPATYYLRVRGSKTATSYRLNLFAVGTGLPTPIPGPIPGPIPAPTPTPNTAPTLSGSFALNALRGSLTPSSTVLTSSSLNATDTQQTASQLIYTLTTLPKSGGLYRSGTALGAGSSFTQAELNSGLVSYQQQAITSLPNTESIASQIVVSGKNAAWINGTGDATEVYFYNGTTGTTSRLTNDSRPDANVQISGDTVVWDSRYSSTDRDIFYSVNGATPLKFDNSSAFNDSNPAISGNLIAFKRDDNSGTNVTNDGVWLYNISSSTTTQLKTSSETVSNVSISGTNVVWSKYYPGNNESDVQFWNGTTIGSVNGSTTFDDINPVISGNLIAFQRKDSSSATGPNNGVYLYNISGGTTTQLESGTQDIASLFFEKPISISGTNVAWTRKFGSSDYDLRYSVNSGSPDVIDSSSTLQDFGAQLSGSVIAFARSSPSDPTQTGIYLKNIGGSLTRLSAAPSGTLDLVGSTDSQNFAWTRIFGPSAGFFYDGTSTTDSVGFTVSDGSLTTSGTLNIAIS